MKILLMSDSHRNVRNMAAAVEREVPDTVFHLGDLARDAEELTELYPELPLIMVRGNCDGFSAGLDIPGTAVRNVGEVGFLLTHGHIYDVNHGCGMLLREGRQRGVSAVLFGHTHIPLVERQPDGLWLINPGTVGGARNKPTYALLQVENGRLAVEIKPL